MARDDAPGSAGALLLVGAAFLFSIMSVLVKTAGRTLPVEMLILARGVVTLMMSYVWLRAKGMSPWGVDKPRLILRGLFGVGGLACFFTAVTRLPLAEVTVIHYLNPVLTALLAGLFLRELIDSRLVLAIAVSIAGTLLVTRPGLLLGTTSALDPVGVAAALGGATFSACAYTTVRRLTKTDHAHVIVFYFPLVAVPLTLPFVIGAWVWPRPVEWLLLLGIGVVTQLAQVLLTRGLGMVPAGRGTAIGYSQIAFAALWGMVLFGERLSGWTVGGAALIALATLSLIRRRRTPQPARP